MSLEDERRALIAGQGDGQVAVCDMLSGESVFVSNIVFLALALAAPSLAAPIHKVCLVVGYSYYAVDGQTKQVDIESKTTLNGGITWRPALKTEV